MMKQKRAQQPVRKPPVRKPSRAAKNLKVTMPNLAESPIESERSSSSTASDIPEVQQEKAQYSDDDVFSLRASQSSHSVLSYFIEVEESESEHREEFLLNFESIPDIENISEDVSVVDVVEVEADLPQEVPVDVGHFVDPISGARDSEGSLPQPTEAIRPPTPEPEAKSDSEQDLKLSDLMITESKMLGSQESELNLLLPDEISFYEDIGDRTGDKKHAYEEPKDALESFFEMVEEKVEVKVEVIDWTAMARDHEHDVIKQQTKEFLMELIYKVVHKAEYRSDEEILQQNLDKRKLLVIFAEKCIEFSNETAYNQQLDQRLTNHLLRKKALNQITPSRLDAACKPKYIAALWKLEENLTRESATRKKYETIKSRLVEEFKECEEKLKAEMQAFETLVKLKLSGNDLEHPNYRILPHIAEMREFRKRVSQTRLRLVLLEDTHAKLKIRLNELEDLSSDLTITDYYNLYHQNQAWQKKLEERDNDFNKLHFRLKKHIHVLAHYDETKTRLHEIIGMQRDELEDRKLERDALRRHLQKLTIQRIHTRQQILEMSSKAGLLDKPLLMHDYDKTIEILKEQREVVARLRATVATLQSKINVLEKRLSPNLSINDSIK